jgi:hypothetical protein
MKREGLGSFARAVSRETAWPSVDGSRSLTSYERVDDTPAGSKLTTKRSRPPALYKPVSKAFQEFVTTDARNLNLEFDWVPLRPKAGLPRDRRRQVAWSWSGSSIRMNNAPGRDRIREASSQSRSVGRPTQLRPLPAQISFLSSFGSKTPRAHLHRANASLS